MIDEKLDPEFAAIAARMTETEALGYVPLLDGRAQAAANIACGNSKAFLLQTLYLCVPYNGYPRTLNAIACVENAAK